MKRNSHNWVLNNIKEIRNKIGSVLMVKSHTDQYKSSVFSLQLYEVTLKQSFLFQEVFFFTTAHKVSLKFITQFLRAICMKICLFEI